ncbi:MAG: S8 family serine peptidase [Bacilli bacterium]|nr:S8 family serine peptidase [Bacilli bacterium]
MFKNYIPADFGLNPDVIINDLTNSYFCKENLKSDFRRILEFDFSNSNSKIEKGVYDILKESKTIIHSLEYSAKSIYFYTPNDPLLGSSSTDTTKQYYLHKISMPSAWNIETGSSSVTVGLIDSGVNFSNNDIDSSRFSTYDATGLGREAYAPVISHGTMTGGIIAASTNNSTYIAGICQNVLIKNIRADVPANNYEETVSSIISSINYATSQNIPIINYSGGFYYQDLYNNALYDNGQNDGGAALRQAIINYDGLVVVASGNGYFNLNSTPCYPSSWDLPNVISVGASNVNDNIWCWPQNHNNNSIDDDGSNYSNIHVHLFAPGEDIISTSGTSTSKESGTSFAAPQVAAVAALVLSKYPSMTTYDLKDTILSNVDVISSLSNYCTSGGRLNAQMALSNPVYHSHNHTFNYQSAGQYKHRAYCECGDYLMEFHIWDEGYTWMNNNGVTFGYCDLCGGTMRVW